VDCVKQSEAIEIDDDEDEDDQATDDVVPVEPLVAAAAAKEMAIQLERKLVDISDDAEYSALVRDVLRRARRMLAREEAEKMRQTNCHSFFKPTTAFV